MNSGDSVTWMQVTKKYGWSMSFSEREGKIVSINGAVARVKLRNGRETEILVENLRRSDEKGHVTELFEKLTEGLSSAPAGESSKTPDAGASEKG